MAKARLQLQQFERDFKNKLNRTLSASFMRSVGRLMIDLVVERTRSGFGAKREEGPKILLKRLSPAYIKYRQRYQSRLDTTTSPSKSNLTFSGQLLRSMVVHRSDPFKVSVGPNRSRRKEGITNEQLGEIVSKVRPFLYLTKNEYEVVVRFIEDELTRAIRRK